MKSLFKVKVLDHSFVDFGDYETAFKVAVKVRQAYRRVNPNVTGNLFKYSDIPGFMLMAN